MLHYYLKKKPEKELKLDILDAAGYDYVIFETVGVGQSELDIAKAADTTIVVLVPESGDAIQAMKSGIRIWNSAQLNFTTRFTRRVAVCQRDFRTPIPIII